MVAKWNIGLFAHAASGRMAHSRYQGWTTGKKITNSNVATPSPPTGWIRPRNAAHSIRMTQKAPTAMPTARKMSSAAVWWSPNPSTEPKNEDAKPANVDKLIQLMISAAPPWEVIQPNFTPVMSEKNTAVAVAMAPVRTAASARWLSLAPHYRAMATPTNPSAISAVTLIIPAQVTSTVPLMMRNHRLIIGRWKWSTPRRTNSMPASKRPSKRASL